MRRTDTMGGRDKSGTAEVVATSLQGKNVWLGVGLNDGTADDVCFSRDKGNN